MNPKRLITPFLNVLKFYGFNNPEETFRRLNQDDKIKILRNYYVLGSNELNFKLSFQ